MLTGVEEFAASPLAGKANRPIIDRRNEKNDRSFSQLRGQSIEADQLEAIIKNNLELLNYGE